MTDTKQQTAGAFVLPADQYDKNECLKVFKNDNLDNALAKVTQHKLICDTLTAIYKQKNHDYGDSFAKVREIVHNSVLVRLMDKLERLKTLMGKGEQAQVIDEGVDDTLMDMANYCIMELIERQFERQELNEKVKERLNEKTEFKGKQPLE